ncbi:MAG: hypothetical protein WCC17_20560 [Candidatus Nitrosopolaris sp.]
MTTVRSLQRGSANGQFNYPEGITVDKLGHIALGNVYVVEHGNDRIEKFDSNGKFITAWGSLGTSNGQFNRISDVCGFSRSGDNVQVFGLS